MILFIALVLILKFFSTRPAPLRRRNSRELELLEQHALLVRQAAPLEQLRPPEPGAPQGLLQTPAADRRVVARSQDLRHFAPVHRDRPRVVRPIQEPLAEGLLQRRLLAPERARQK